MKVFLLLFLVFGSVPAYAKEVPDKFRNPVFNDTLWTANKNLAHTVKITPTYIEDIEYRYDEICEYITEDDKGILLKCDVPYSHVDEYYVNYEMFYVRYQLFQSCSVWWCSFEIEEGEIRGVSMGVPLALSSNIYKCADEIDEQDFSYGGPKMNCLEELKARGWEKYLPGKLPTDEKYYKKY